MSHPTELPYDAPYRAMPHPTELYRTLTELCLTLTELCLTLTELFRTLTELCRTRLTAYFVTVTFLISDPAKMFIQSFTGSGSTLYAEGVSSGRECLDYLRHAHQLPAHLSLRLEYNGRTLTDLDAR
jgi:hypothetical protein